MVHAVVHGEVRSPDARSPFVTAAGFWRCPTSGRIDLRISSDAQATLSSGGQPLASASLGRALVNRTCERRRVAPRPPIDAPRGTRGAASLRCQVPSSVLVGFSDGDLVVHGTHDGRFLAGAAVGYARVDVAGYWTAACAPY